MKKHPIKKKGNIYIKESGATYAIPREIAARYIINTEEKIKKNIPAKEIFADLDKKFTEAGALLKGLRARENLTQIKFAAKIKVTQANLSKMENGKRPIGKQIAKRIEKIFMVSYKYFLE